MMNLSSVLKNPYLGHAFYKPFAPDTLVMDPFYPCIKYKIPADPKLDGTDYFIFAETMHYRHQSWSVDVYDCSLSFTCTNDQKAFYKLLKDCLRLRI